MTTPAQAGLTLEHTLVDELPGLTVKVDPQPFPDPKLVLANHGLAAELGIDDAQLAAEAAAWLGGQAQPTGAEPVAVAYAGHQFGSLNPQLGDGRALLLGEIVAPDGGRFDLQVKGSGRTPFSRGGDGRAALDSVLREYLVSESMHALGIPTTRALAAITTGETVRRDQLAPGAVLARVASSHLRIGTLVYLAVRGNVEGLKQVVDYTLRRHYPDRVDAPVPALALLEAVADVQADLVAQWMLVGFVHGVMNTDNVALSGETLDYGPCAFMEATDPATVFSRIDHAARYAYGRQPGIALWNLARMAETVLPLLSDDESEAVKLAESVLDRFRDRYQATYLQGMARKIGLPTLEETDAELVTELLEHMQQQRLDYTTTFRRLADDLRNGEPALGMNGPWDATWRARLGDADPAAVADTMDSVNPLYIPRNHKVEEVLGYALVGNLDPLRQMLEVLSDPYTIQAGREAYAQPAPDDAMPYQTHCNT